MKAILFEENAVNTGDVTWEPLDKVCDVTYYDHTYDDQKWDRLGGYEIVLTNKIVIDEEVLERFPEIRYIGACATGFNHIDVAAAKRRGIVVTNIPSYSTNSVVQQAWALILEIVSQPGAHVESVMKRREWVNSSLFSYWVRTPVELYGKTIGIYGFGSIGRGVARVAEAFGMKVLVYTKNPQKYVSYESDRIHFTDADTLFSESDIISMHCPLNDETRGVICAESIRKMKNGMIFINTARGPLVVEEDLRDALESGKIAFAGLDCVCHEPMREDDILLTAPNVMITPHIGWASRESRQRLIDIIADNVKCYLEGHPKNVVSG